MSASKTKKTVTGAAAAGVIAAAVGIIQPWEGRRFIPYYDIVGVLTWCDGETRGKPKASYTSAECDTILAKAVLEFEQGIRPCLPAVMPIKTRGAFVSTAYNIGVGGFCGSSMSRKALAGDLKGACDALLLWNKAGGKVVKGLVNRRAAERKICLEGLSAGPAAPMPEPAAQTYFNPFAALWAWLTGKGA